MKIPAFPKSRILFVIDLNDSLQPAIRIAVRAAQSNDLPLTVLYPCRQAEITAHEGAFHIEAREAFRKIAAPFLDNHCIDCEFRAEFGSMKDRVYAFARKNRLSLMILAEDTANRHRDGLNELLDMIDVPLLIIPKTSQL